MPANGSSAPPPTQPEEIEMDLVAESSAIARGRSRSVIRTKLTESLGNSALSRKDYALGIVLLLVVVTLWTFSNFVTQVR